MTYKGKLFLLGLFGAFWVVLWGYLMWVFRIRFIYKVCVCGFVSKLCFLLWFCGCDILLHHVIFEILRFCYVGIWTLTSTWDICKWVPFKNFKCYFLYFVLLSSKKGNIEWMVVYCNWYITNEWLYIIRPYNFCPILKKILIVEKIKFSWYNLRIQTSIVPKKFTLVRLISESHQIILLIHYLQYLCRRLLINNYNWKELRWWGWSLLLHGSTHLLYGFVW